MPQDWFSANAPQTQAAPPPGGDWFASNAPTFKSENEKDSAGNAVVSSHVSDFAGEVGHALNPVEWVKGLYGMATDLVGTAKGMGAQHERIFRDGQAALRNGDYVTAGRKFVNYLVPIVGPITDRSADLMAEGKYGKGAGVMAGFGLQAAIPGAVSRVPRVRVPVAPRNINAAERAAVDFGMREGISVDAATATGNRFVRSGQRVADESLAGGAIGGRARQAQAEGFATVGDRLAARTNPAPVTAEQAGQGVRDAVRGRGNTLNAEATTAYDRLRALEAQATPQTVNVTQAGRTAGGGSIPVNVPTSMRLAVDIAPTKAAMQPIYEALKREAELVPLMGDKARALTSLDRLMNAPDKAPLSIADAALSDIKTMARVDEAFKRTTGQGVAAQAVTNLDRAVVTAAKQGGPDVFKALMDGRAATINKYKSIEVFDALRAEPVRVFNQLTANKDSAVSLLRQVQREAPKELPRLGRAYLDGLLEKAKAAGGFDRADGLFQSWQNLGAESKRLMFRDPGLVRDLDQFFLLAKKTAENPNPSGTAFTLLKGGELTLLVNNPVLGIPVTLSGAALSKLLHSPRAVRLMVRGLRLPLGNRAASATASAELAAIARESGVPLAPSVAETEP